MAELVRKEVEVLMQLDGIVNRLGTMEVDVEYIDPDADKGEVVARLESDDIVTGLRQIADEVERRSLAAKGL